MSWVNGGGSGGGGVGGSGGERSNLILSFNELANEEANIQPTTLFNDGDSPYATADEAFFDQNIFSFVADEVHAMMHFLCCEARFCATFYNPLYLVLFGLLYVLTIPGALSHWALLTCIPVRKREFAEVRELRSQGIYTAIGVAIISIPFAVIGLFLGSDIMVLINELALAVNCAIIVTNLIGLKVIADDMIISIRTYAVGAWSIVALLIGLALFDVYEYLTFSWITTIEYTFRIVLIIVYTIIAVQCIQLWNLYDDDKSAKPPNFCHDVMFAIVLGSLFIGIFIGFAVAIYISEESAWRIMYFR